MSFATAYVIYGIQVDADDFDDDTRTAISRLADRKLLRSIYSAHDDNFLYLGAQISSFGEGTVTFLEKVSLEQDAGNEDVFQGDLAAIMDEDLTDELRNFLENSKPRVFCIVING